MDRRVMLPLMVYAATAYTLTATRPECMFDQATGMPKAFGTGPNECLLPFWLAALVVAYMSTHFMMPVPRPPAYFDD